MAGIGFCVVFIFDVQGLWYDDDDTHMIRRPLS